MKSVLSHKFRKLIATAKLLPSICFRYCLRLISIYGLVVCTLFAAPSLSVAQSFDKKIVFELKEKSLAQGIKQFEKLSGFRFTYSAQQVAKYSHITIEKGSRTVESTLSLLLSSTNLTYKIKGSNILIIEKASVRLSVSQSASKFSIRGTVSESTGKRTSKTLPYATISIPDYALYTTTGGNGNFALRNVPAGKVNLKINFVGKLPIDTVIVLNEDLDLNFVLYENNFRLKMVVVSAESNKSGVSTSSLISKTAMDHLQATSLKDILSLLPGALTQNQSLNTASQVSIRNIASSSNAANLTALGTSILKDGAPISNNANLQTMNPTVVGGVSALGGDASPAGGVDIRNISVENIESVEVIRGIPSVEYGDVTSGVVILNTKAGREPLRIKAKTNPNVYQISAGKGYDLGNQKGSLNFSGDYAYNVNDPTQSYLHYERATGSIKYSNNFFNHKWTTNTSLGFLYSKNGRDNNPDDKVTQTASGALNIGGNFNTNGTIIINKGWLKNIRYTTALNYTVKNSYYEQLYTSANAPYSATVTDGAILSNKPNTDIYDATGNKITNISEADKNNYAIYLPSSYLARYDIHGKEIGAFGKVTANLFKKLGKTDNRLVVGLDVQSDGNNGSGKQFSSAYPPYRNLSAVNASFRPRSYKNIPFVNQFGLFMEDNFSYSFGDRKLKIQTGVRYDLFSVVGDIITPRINTSFDIIPDVLTLKGGYGIQAKAPTLLYLYPENAYFEYININEIANTSLPENERLFITTTKVYNTQNKDLKIARNKRLEFGFGLKIKKATLDVTAFNDRLVDGYSMGNTINTFQPFTYNEYTRTTSGIVLSASNPVLSKFYTPTNDVFINTKGLEFDMNLGRIEAIRTSVTANGAWIKSENYDNNYTFFDDYSSNGGASRTNIGLYEIGMEKRCYEQLVTTLRLTHNIPEIGFVVTLTAQATWIDKDWYKFGNDSLPVKYISKQDGKVYDFDPALKNNPEFSTLIRHVNQKYYITESLPPLFCFNINVTKEIGDFLRVSFFANNMFRDYPIAESKRNLGTYYVRNNSFFFGLELSIFLK